MCDSSKENILSYTKKTSIDTTILTTTTTTKAVLEVQKM
jgi:hypothetical protein